MNESIKLMTDEECLRQLVSRTCTPCGGTKPARMSHCRSCYRALPPPMRQRLYDRVGAGYAEAYAESLRYLKERKAQNV